MLVFGESVSICKFRVKLVKSYVIHFSGRDVTPQPIYTSCPC